MIEMKRKNCVKILLCGAALVLTFVLWTFLVKWVDVQQIGPEKSSVGFSSLNGFVHNFFGVHMDLYYITDWLSLVPVGFIFGFAVVGLVQWISRKSIRKVDMNILVLGGFYVVVLSAYIFFEYYVVNYRPVLISGFLEASYPSSTTLLVLTVMPTAVMMFVMGKSAGSEKNSLENVSSDSVLLSAGKSENNVLFYATNSCKIKNRTVRKVAAFLIILFTVFMVAGRLISGVHWITDIIGGIILSAGLVMIYYGVVSLITES